MNGTPSPRAYAFAPTPSSSSQALAEYLAVPAAVHESAIGTKRTFARALHMSAFGGKADTPFCTAHVRF